MDFAWVSAITFNQITKDGETNNGISITQKASPILK